MSGEDAALKQITELAIKHKFWDQSTAGEVNVCRTSSRFCLGVEHGDYNGTELFGVGTDRFIWLAYRPTDTGKIRLLSHNFPDDGVVEFAPGSVRELMTTEERESASWKQFPLGVDYVLTKHGFDLKQGFDAIIYGNIPGRTAFVLNDICKKGCCVCPCRQSVCICVVHAGGGMSRSASLTINLILVNLRVNDLKHKYEFQIVELSQQVENEFIGSPCGQLDQIMIYFAKSGMGTHFNPKTKAITYVELGKTTESDQLRIVGLDTGTTRHGLESSTYNIRSQV